MKFGMTSMRSGDTLKSRTVSARRYSETAVSPSDSRIEKRVIAWKDGCSPTRVMSVPCSVVTILSGLSPSSIRRARNADAACGIA